MKKLFMKLITNIKECRYEKVRHITIWCEALLVSSFWLVIFVGNFILTSKVEPLIFLLMFITFTSTLIGTYNGVILKSLKQLVSYTEYNNKKQRDILGCDVTCDSFGEYSICIYDYSSNALLLREDEAKKIAHLQGKDVKDMITIAHPIEVIINSPESAYTLVLDDTAKAKDLIDSFINGENLIELGFTRRQ